ncbi:hypothetical protein JCGZ_22191 [Jatropha curcas]|uniref:MBD domain-containing protein n=1 Tax=Jatropha curcas TaxID=180498 RepID=A0A067JSN6_JATCU|nr:hypothetical protein JCGZ_22191 [Jatropha curcas]
MPELHGLGRISRPGLPESGTGVLEVGDGVENLALRIGTVRQPNRPNWENNWVLRPRQRKDGRIDKYYYHKETDIMCRSMVEVNEYELYGLLPKHMRKVKKEIASENASSSEEGRKGSLKRKRIHEEDVDNIDNDDYNEENANWATADHAAKEIMKRRVEEFFRESYEHLHNFFNRAPQESTEKGQREVQEDWQEEGDEIIIMMEEIKAEEDEDGLMTILEYTEKEGYPREKKNKSAKGKEKMEVAENLLKIGGKSMLMEANPQEEEGESVRRMEHMKVEGHPQEKRGTNKQDTQTETTMAENPQEEESKIIAVDDTAECESTVSMSNNLDDDIMLIDNMVYYNFHRF